MPQTQLKETARGGYGGGGGGYGGGGYGGGGHGGYGGGYVDPYVVLASLGFGVFLFNIIYNLLNRSTRSIDIDDIDIPLHQSDMAGIIDLVTSNETESKWDHFAATANHHHTGFFPATSKALEMFQQSFVKGFQVVKSIRKDPDCAKPLLCKLWNDPGVWNKQPYAVIRAMQLYIVSLAQYYGASGIAEYADSVEENAGSATTCPHIQQCPEIDFNSD